MSRGEFRIEYLPLAKVKTWPSNPRTHDEDKLDASIDRFGFIAPLMLDEATGQMVAGHGRLESLLRRKAAGKAPPSGITEAAGDWLVPVVRGVQFRDEAEAEAYLLADNRLNEKGGWDNGALAAMMKDLNALNDKDLLASIGYTPTDAKAILREIEDAAAPAVGRDPSKLTEGFLNAEEKQVVLYFDAKEYDVFSPRFEMIQKALGASSPGDALEKMLDRFFEAEKPILLTEEMAK